MHPLAHRHGPPTITIRLIDTPRHRRGPPDELSDEELVTAARDGDRAAMETLLERHHAAIHTICRRILGRDADDATQETLIKVVRSLDRFDGRSRFSTWIYRIATNSALDEIRRRSRRPAVHLVDANEPHDASATDAIERIGDALLLDSALAALPDDQRAAVVLRDVIGLDHAEIADVLEIPIGTTKSRVARGRARLLEFVGPASGPDGNQTEGARRHNPTQDRRP